MRYNYKKHIWFNLMVVAYLSLSYYYFGKWWHSSVGTLLILMFSYLIWNKKFLKETGLYLNLKIVTKSIILAVAFILGSLFLMTYLAGKENVLIQYTSWKAYYHDVFYVLNEEIMLGALILFPSVYKKRIHPIVAAAGLAVLFSIIHFVFYKWIFLEKGILGISTLCTLFFVGFVRNALIIRTGHIGYSWALHFGWIAIMFGSNHVYSGTNLKLTEPIRFNSYLGSNEMLIISMLLALLSLALFINSKGKANTS